MKVKRLKHRTAADIDSRIERVHKDIGYTGGKIDLRVVRDRLRLDLQYYRSDDPSLVEEVLHKLTVAGKQILARPMLFFEAARKFDLGAFYLPDRKRILLDTTTVPKLKLRWTEAHEIGHSVLPWHEAYTLGDDRSTISETCHELIEAEANYGAGRLLFPNMAFEEVRRASTLTHARIREIATHFGNTITSTLWRCIERDEGVVFGCIGEHPRRARPGEPRLKYFVTSPQFEAQFSSVTEEAIWAWLQSYCSYATRGPLGTAEIIIHDANGERHVFHFESFGIQYYVHTVARYHRVAVSQVTAPSLLIQHR
jgi:Zn-dependent peptidase ImmA (M78 family)